MFETIMPLTLTAEAYFLCTLFAILSGAIVAAANSFRNHTSRSMVLSLALLPVIVANVIMLVNGSVGTGLAVMGAFSLVRFRSTPGKARDIIAIFAVMMAGLACAQGYIWISLISVLVVSVGMVVGALLPLACDKTLDLRITIPEDLNYTEIFSDLFARYTKRHTLIKVKTSNLGSFYRLQYQVLLKKNGEAKEFMDAIRCRNGNLEVSMSPAAESEDAL